MKTDEFDIKILNIVQQNARLTTEQMAEQVGLSPSAVQRRLKKLREERIIEAEIAVISPEAVGRTITAIVEVTLEREHPQIIKEFKNAMLSRPEVMQCYYVTGNADFILIVTAKDMKDYDNFTQKFFDENSNVKKFQTSVVINRVKFGLMVPVEVQG